LALQFISGDVMKRLWSFWIILFGLIICTNPLTGGSSSGTAGYEFLRTHIGARPSAMAGAFICIPGDIHAIYFNPAGLASISGRLASATYLNHVLDFQSGFIAYTQPIKSLGQMAVGINYMNYGDFDQTDINGNKIGSFGAGSFAIISSLGRSINEDLMAGVSVKFIYSSIDEYNSTALALDLGAIYKVPFIDDMNVGFGIFNVGQALTAFMDHKDPLPLNFVLGISKKLAHLPLEYCITANKYIDDDIQFNVGGEFTLTEGVFLRIGYNSLGRELKIGADGDQFAGISLGLGFHWKQMQFDYGLSSFGAIGYLNRATFSYRF
jgi:hypothetical protein